MVDQLFKILPDLYTLEKLLKCFELDNIKHNLIICKNNYNKIDIIDKFIDLKPLLEKKYRKYKLNKLYDNLNFRKCITIFRHILCIYNYKLIKIKDDYKFINLETVKHNNRVTISFD
tara:strand:+ start:1175 stop:1525 length:351 start_codon:yes stop_codon:yes gene_type:complete